MENIIVNRIGISQKTPLRSINIVDKNELKATSALSSELNIPIHVLDIYNHWIEVKNKKYYYKQTRSATRIVLEILGEYISKFMGLDTVEYVLATDDKGICGLLSENYRKPNIEYVQSYQLTKEELSHIRKTLSIPLIKRDKTLEEELAKYIMRNFYTTSGDRDGNVLCQRVNNKVHLAPLYDYECSFAFDLAEKYNDKLFMKEDGTYLTIDIELIARLIRKSKIMRYYFNKILSLNMPQTLLEIEDNNGIIIPDSIKDRLNQYDEARKNLMLRKTK